MAAPPEGLRPPEIVEDGSGRTHKLACMSCIRGHRTKTCGGQHCHGKILWTVKRPGRPSNSCFCKSNTAGSGKRCVCVLAKTQCPHKPKKGEKRTVDCRCDERGRFCVTLDEPMWKLVGDGERPVVKLFRNLEELEGRYVGQTAHGGFVQGVDMLAPDAHRVINTPGTPGTPGSNGHMVYGQPHGYVGTQTQPWHGMNGSEHAYGVPPPLSGPPRFGMMGIGAPMGGEEHQGQDVLAWQGTTPVAPAPRRTYPTPNSVDVSSPSAHSAVIESFATPLRTPFSYDSPVHQHPDYHPQPGFSNQIQAPQYDQPPLRHIPQDLFDTVPPVTATLSDLSVMPNLSLPALTDFDMNYFHFQSPSAFCQQCGTADCTCRACPTVLQNTTDGSWQQCCSKQHVFGGPAVAAVQGGQTVAKSCCSSKATAPAQNLPPAQQPQQSVPDVVPLPTSNSSGCCAGRSRPPPDTTLDYSTATDSFPHTTSTAHEYDTTAFLDPDPTASDIPPDWLDADMDFEDFINEDMKCDCGPDCPCGIDDGGDMEVDVLGVEGAFGGE